MKRFFVVLFVVLFLMLPGAGGAATSRTFSGRVTNISGNEIMFVTASGAYYNVQTQSVGLVRRYGAPMLVSEMLVGDKVQVTGLVFSDNKITASLIKDISLYTHTGTVSGKIAIVNPLLRNFTVINSQRQTLTIQTDSTTAITKNGGYATLGDLSTGVTVSVKGTWERSSLNVRAMTVKATVRLVNIYITGNLVMKGPGSMTVVGNNNAIYGVILEHAQLQSKNGKPMLMTEFNMTDKVRVWGKHISGVAEIYASLIKDTAVNK